MHRWLFCFLLFWPRAAPATELSKLDQAKKHYESGVSLFDAGNKEQALVEFQLAHDLAPRKENVFMIAQCEYHVGSLVSARNNYQAFLDLEDKGEYADLARLRIEAINRRPGVFAINSIPDPVDVRIEGGGKVFVGQSPGNFPVPRGQYQITVSKKNYLRIIKKVSIEVAQTIPLIFKLDPIPAYLEVHTQPKDAFLYVQGNRTTNPYMQEVPAGNFEIYAEAPFYKPRRDFFSVKPGEHRVVQFPLTYVQRSGRPELIGSWTGLGAIGGGLAVLTRGDPSGDTSLSIPLFAAGMLGGGIGAGVLSAALAPSYIRDNLALFRIGGMWIGDVEGLTLGMALTQDWTWAWLSGAAGLGGGALAGWWLDRYAPNYGRVALIQSAALWGVIGGLAWVPMTGHYPVAPRSESSTDEKNAHQSTIKKRLSWGTFAGLNVGLATGMAMAYLPDQRKYGPSWQRVFLVDLAGIAGGFFSGVLEICTRAGTLCADAPPEGRIALNRRTARFAFVGTGVGLVAGWLLTRSYDFENQSLNSESQLPLLPLPGALPVESVVGSTELLPGLVARGRF